MKVQIWMVSGVFLTAVASTAVSVPAHALTMKECSAKYQAAKKAGTLHGMKWNEFRKTECGATATATPAAGGTPPPPPPTTTTTTTTKPGKSTKPASPGRQAYLARLHACSAEWKADKAANKRPPGLKWPQFWHECDVRMKAKGM